MVAAVTEAARVIAAGAYAAVAVLTAAAGLKRGPNRGWMAVEAVSWLTVGVLYLTVSEENILLPLMLSLMILLAIPAPRRASGRGQ